VGTVRGVSKREGRNITECLQRRNYIPARNRVAGRSVDAEPSVPVKAGAAREVTARCTERTLGVGGATLSDRIDVKAGTVRWTSRGWPKRQRLWLIDPGRRAREATGSAHGLIVARKEGNASRAKEPWVVAVVSRAGAGTLSPGTP